MTRDFDNKEIMLKDLTPKCLKTLTVKCLSLQILYVKWLNILTVKWLLLRGYGSKYFQILIVKCLGLTTVKRLRFWTVECYWFWQTNFTDFVSKMHNADRLCDSKVGIEFDSKMLWYFKE